MTDYDYLLKTSEIYPLDNRKLCPWFNVDNYYLRGMKHMWPATRVFHRSCQIICIRHDLKGSLTRILQRTESRFSNDTWEAKRRFFINVKDNNSSRPGGWGGAGEIPLYKLYRYVPPHWVGFLCRFGLKRGVHFAYFGLESGMVFEGTTGVYERIYRFNSKWVRQKEKYARSK